MTRAQMAQAGWRYACDALWGKGTTRDIEDTHLGDQRCGLVDAVTNLRHFAEQRGLDWDTTLGTVDMHFEAEMLCELNEETV